MSDISKRGSDCDEGERGERGKRGKRGHRGHDGERGERGEQGERGHDGNDGATGPTGSTGPTAAAATGPTGPAGPDDGIVADPTPPTLTGNGTEESPLQVINVAPQAFPEGTVPVTTTIYARITGSDETGDGTLANPYRTFQRAVLDVPMFIQPGRQYVVDITGIGTEVLPPDYAVPPFKSAAPDIFVNLDPIGIFSAPFTVRATPQPVASLGTDAVINAGDVLTSTPDPVTGLFTITLTAPRAGFAGNALSGKLIIGPGPQGQNTVIASSTINSITLAQTTAPVFPLVVSEQSAALAGSAVRNLRAVSSLHLDTQAWIGISFPNGLAISGTGSPAIVNCDVVGGNFDDPHLGSQFFGSFLHDGSFVFNGYAHVFSRVYFKNITGGLGYGASHINFLRCWFENVGALRAVGLLGQPIAQESLLLSQCEMFLSAGVISSGGRAQLQNTRLRDNSSNAFTADGPHLSVLTNVAGTNNVGVGVRATRGAHVDVTATTVTGTINDLQSGDLPPNTYASLPQFDITAVGPGGATGTGSRIF